LCITNMLPHFCFFCSYMNCYWFWNILSLQFVEKFQNDEIELFEEPTIEEMVRWVLLTKRGNREILNRVMCTVSQIFLSMCVCDIIRRNVKQQGFPNVAGSCNKRDGTGR
jgi:hypothetical protein